MTTSTALAPANLPPEVALMMNTLREIAVEDDSMGTSLQIMDTILAQSTEEEIFGAAEAGTISSENYVGIPFRVKSDSISWRKSAPQYTDEGAFPYYALIRIADEDGKPAVLNCGGVSVVPTIFALWDKGILERYDADGGMPLVLAVEKTNSGWDLIKLRKHDGKKK